MNTDFFTSPLRSLAAVFLPEYLLAILSLASSTSRAISEGMPASTASPIPDIELGNLQRISIASSTRRILLASEMFSLLNASPKRPLNGVTSWLKKESIVPIGASSSKVSNCSDRPECVTLGSVLPEELDDPVFNFEISSLNLCLISSAALLVKVSNTTSPGSNPGWSFGSTVSEEGDRSVPPEIGRGLSGIGRILVAL